MARKKLKRDTPQKQCPKCKKRVHARKAECNCGYKFTSAKRKAPPARKKKAAPGLKAQLVSERDALQKRMAAIDTLLETYGS